MKSLAQRIQPLGLSEIEFGNEVYYDGKTTPPVFAAQYAAAHAAVVGMGVKLIANSYGDYERTNGSWSQDDRGGGWIHDFVAALRAHGTQVDSSRSTPTDRSRGSGKATMTGGSQCRGTTPSRSPPARTSRGT